MAFDGQSIYRRRSVARQAQQRAEKRTRPHFATTVANLQPHLAIPLLHYYNASLSALSLSAGVARTDRNCGADCPDIRARACARPRDCKGRSALRFAWGPRSKGRNARAAWRGTGRSQTSRGAQAIRRFRPAMRLLPDDGAGAVSRSSKPPGGPVHVPPAEFYATR